MNRRLQAIDVLRGVIMVVMALDHVRDFFSSSDLNPTDLATTTPGLFATRWLTHFCAPVFMFLAGTGAKLSSKSRGELAAFLASRGAFLIVLELTIVRFAWVYAADWNRVVLIVLWALGSSMLVLALLVAMQLPTLAIAVFGGLMVLGHNAFDQVHGGALWSVLHVQGPIALGSLNVRVGYPLVPWVGVMALGYAYGQIVTAPNARLRTFLIGGGVCVLFVILRVTNVYGDPHSFVVQSTPLYSVFAFVNTQKYPPSLDYLCMTLGPALMLLSAIYHVRLDERHPFVVFGRVPMFYYIVHLYLIHIAQTLYFWPRYGTAVLHLSLFGPHPAGFGLPLPGVYAVWLTIVALLYAPCLWYARLKQRSRNPWLSYI